MTSGNIPGGSQRNKWVAHLNTMNQLLAIAPCQWLRRLYAFCRKPFLPLDTEGTLMYAIWSARTERVYIGQTCGIGQLKKAIVRFMQHIRSAQSWHTPWNPWHGTVLPHDVQNRPREFWSCDP